MDHEGDSPLVTVEFWATVAGDIVIDWFVEWM